MFNLSDTHIKSEMHSSLTPISHTIETIDGTEASIYFTSLHFTLHKGDAKSVLEKIESSSIDCIVTSPPYYGKRDYGIINQIGLEDHPQTYVDKLVTIFRETYRILKPTGSLWVNIGDTYWSGKGRSHGIDPKQKNRRFTRPQDKTGKGPWCVPKQLLLIPHRFAIAMEEDGWIVRNDNVWHKPSPIPDPVADRSSLSHEYIFHFVKQKKYYYNRQAVAIPSNGKSKTKPPLSVWTVPTITKQNTRLQKKHIAVFPEQLVSLPIKATCPSNGLLLDPFCGSGTALHVAVTLGEGRKAVGIDISEKALQEAQMIAESVEKAFPVKESLDTLFRDD